MIVSHRRSGTHLLAALLHRNLHTGAPDYEALHYSHSNVPQSPYVCVHRPALPTMVSIWRMRQRFGIASGATFRDLLRVPYPELPKADACDVVLDGERKTDAWRIRDCEGTLLDKWLKDTSRFIRGAKVAVPYISCVEEPLRVLDAVAMAFRLECKPAFAPVFERVGWWSIADETPVADRSDMADIAVRQELLLAECGDCLRRVTVT